MKEKPRNNENLPDNLEKPLSAYGYSRFTEPLTKVAASAIEAGASAVAISCYAGVWGAQRFLAKIREKVGGQPFGKAEGQAEFEDGLVLAGVSLSAIRERVRGMLARTAARQTGKEASGDSALLVSNELIGTHCLKSGFFGGLTSAPGTLPGMGTLGTVTVTLSADLLYLLRTQVELCYGISVAYGVEMEEKELRAVAMALIGYSGSNEAVRDINALVIREIIDQAARNYLAAGMNKAITLLLQKMGTKSSGRLIKALPLIGIPIGASVNVATIKTVGNNAKAYFSALKSEGAADGI
ncbi:MAG: EcsC family protein [Desulfobulbaceae bacterium]|nr:EcsC family protein [Desulfobulbaceae bacterium]HIJ79382.1 EcsC family protein [Deltaproteobacteria bacterium]